MGCHGTVKCDTFSEIFLAVFLAWLRNRLIESHPENKCILYLGGQNMLLDPEPDMDVALVQGNGLYFCILNMNTQPG